MSKLQEDLKIYSEEVQDVLSDPPKSIIKWGNTILLLFFILVLLLSWLIKYPDIVQAQATLTTQIPPQKEYAKVTGELDQIQVEEGEQVNPDQVLAVIESSANFKDVYALKSIVDTISIKNNQFKFPIEQIPLLFLGEIESDYAVFENNYLNYRLNKELDPYASELSNNNSVIQELKNRLSNLKSQQQLNASELSFKENELNRNKTLYEKGVISLQEYETQQLAYITSERNFKNIASSIHQLKEAIGNAQQKSRSTTIDMKTDEASLLKKAVQSFHQLKRSIRDWEQKYILKSNIEGTVSFLNYWSTNQSVNQGDWVFTIIPTENSPYIAKLKTPAQNSGKIKIGQQTNLRLANYPDEEFGVLQGKVTHISSLPDSEGFYTVDVQLPEQLITSYQKHIDFKPDMKATAEIITENLRLIERFFYQFKKLLARS